MLPWHMQSQMFLHHPGFISKVVIMCPVFLSGWWHGVEGLEQWQVSGVLWRNLPDHSGVLGIPSSGGVQGWNTSWQFRAGFRDSRAAHNSESGDVMTAPLLAAYNYRNGASDLLVCSHIAAYTRQLNGGHTNRKQRRERPRSSREWTWF